MRILYITDIPVNFVCGSTFFILRTAKLLKERGHEVAFLCPGKDYSDKTFQFDGFDIYGVKSLPAILRKNLRISLPFWVKGRVRQIFNEFKPDVVHFQSHFTVTAVAIKMAKMMKIPAVGTNHFMPENIFHHFHPPKFLESLIIKHGWKHLHKIFQDLDFVSTPTQTAASFLIKSGFQKDVTPISNGVDLAEFKPDNDGRYLQEKFNLPAVPKLLFIGRLDPEKNVDMIIRALPQVLKQTPVHLVIAGTGAMGDALKKQVKQLGLENNVTFTGFVDNKDLPNIFKAVDIFVMPGTAELQSIATMEAMACGLPIVAVNAMALPELVKNYENGFLYEDGDVQVMAEKIITVAKDPVLRSAMSKKSLDFIKKHDINKSIDTFESVYKGVIAKRSVENK